MQEKKTDCSLFLVGMRGTGKTTVANQLSKRTGIRAVDLDARVQTALGLSISEIFRQFGESRFRELETEHLTMLSDEPASIISLGGGAVIAEENRRLIKAAGCCVWLTANPQVLADRIASDEQTATLRPALTSLQGIDEINHLMAARFRFYEDVADFTIDTGSLTVSDIVDQLIESPVLKRFFHDR